MKKFLPWITVLLILVISFGTIYAAVQQSQRREANDPQIQMAEDTARALDRNGQVQGLYGQIDIKSSLAPFVIVYDKTGKPISGSGYLDGKLAKAPVGVLTASKGKDYNAVTWEPQKDVRIAAVSVEAKKYYVLSGRSLREVEKNETATLQIALIGGMIAGLLLVVVFVLSNRLEEY